MQSQGDSHFDRSDSDAARVVGDERLLARFVSGDDAALGELANRYEGPLLGVCYSMLGDRSLAMEAVQDTWLRVVRHGRTYDGRASVKTWLYQIAMNRCRDIGRRVSASRAREAEHDRREADLRSARDGASAVHSMDDRLVRAVQALDEPLREAVVLCYHRGLTHRQAAEVLGVPMGTVKSRLNSALTKLRSALPATWRAQA